MIVRLASEPAGAEVTDLKRGVVLGSTPLTQRVARGAGVLELRVAKDGFAAAQIAVPLDADFDKTCAWSTTGRVSARRSASRPRRTSRWP